MLLLSIRIIYFQNEEGSINILFFINSVFITYKVATTDMSLALNVDRDMAI